VTATSYSCSWWHCVRAEGPKRQKKSRSAPRGKETIGRNPEAVFVDAEELLRRREPQHVVTAMTKFLNAEAAEFQKEHAHTLRCYACVQLGRYDAARGDPAKLQDAEPDGLLGKASGLIESLKNESDAQAARHDLAVLFCISLRSAFVFARRAELELKQRDLHNFLRLSQEAITIYTLIR